MGTPVAGNVPGGREGATSWTDSSGNFWLFGGSGYDSKVYPANESGTFPHDLNDLWEFDTSNQEWTWMGGNDLVNCGTTGYRCVQPGAYGTLGEPAEGNIPGGRYNSASWVDKRGNLWLFGGNGFDGVGDNGYLNDLWEFNPFTNEWAWMGGSNAVGTGVLAGVYGSQGTPAAGNAPGGRMGAVTWTDNSGNLWLFGGLGYDAGGNLGSLNDLWEFNPTTNEWAWMGGSSTVRKTSDGSGSQPGVYGTRGTPAAGNIPGGRQGANAWTDSSGNLWLFGGASNSGNNNGRFNDLWEFTLSTGEWTWVCGSNAPGDAGLTYEPCGDLATNGAVNGFVPAARWQATSWTDGAGQLWLFGGVSVSLWGPEMNDLWVFNPSSKEWAWVSGPGQLTGYGYSGVYGTMGFPAAGDIPGARDSSSDWVDASGNFWLFGGEGYSSVAYYGYLNDFWIFSPSGTTVPRAATPSFSVTTGIYGAAQGVTISDTTTGAVIYYTTDGTTPTVSSTPYTAAITISSTATLKAIATADGFSTSPLAWATYTIAPPAATPTFSVQGGTYSAAQTVTISDATPGATIYFTTNGAAPTASSSVYTAPVTVSATETLKAIATASGFAPSAVASASYVINLPPADFSFGVSPASLTMTGGQSGTTTATITPQNGFNSAVSFSCSGLPSGGSCSFAPATVTPSGAPASTTLTVSTAKLSASANHRGIPIVPEAALAAILCCLGLRKRRGLHMFLLLSMAAVGVTLCGGCSGGGSASTVPPQPVTSTVTVTATSGTFQHTSTLTLTLN
ncbi:MAG TPA: chitobiase/beta-hexosaminidase C-terminal domain-containing protein [Terracidiphilus sp.]